MPPSRDAGSGPQSAQIIDSAHGHGQVVSLTFDDGPHPIHTPALLEVLRRYRVPAVFCLWGDHVREHPEIVRAIVQEGHVLGNHSMHHDHMSGWSAEQIRADLQAAGAAIQAAVPHARVPYFRAPFGEWGESPTVAAQLGMRSLGWRLAVMDWQPPGTEELVRRLTEGITPGAVVVLHDGGGDRSQTVEAVERIIPAYQAAGWRFVLPDLN